MTCKFKLIVRGISPNGLIVTENYSNEQNEEQELFIFYQFNIQMIKICPVNISDPGKMNPLTNRALRMIL